MTGPGDSRPWWASDPPAAADAADDPLEAHRSARRNGPEPTGGRREGGHPGSSRASNGGEADGHAGGSTGASSGRRDAGGRPGGSRRSSDPGGAGPGEEPPWEPPAAWSEATQLLAELLADLGGAGARQAFRQAARSRAGGAAARAHPPECRVCPACSLLRAVGDVRPEVVSHLTEAARQLTLAAKAVMDAQAGAFDRAEGLQHIPLDEDDPP